MALVEMAGASQLTSEHRITTNSIGSWNIFTMRFVGFLRL